MPSASKSGPSSKDRRKSDKVESKNGSGLMVILNLRPELLSRIFNGAPAPSIKEDSPPIKDTESPATSTTVPAAPPSNPENPSDSTPNTPTASGTPAPPSTMGPPIEGPKKKGVKRSAAGANGNGSDAPQKVRGKPGPKKKARLDDGNLDSGRANGLGHKLGPKANQGAINAGLRALDRSGKPCRKWTKGGFQLKSFTGVVWDIPRWTAPPRPRPEADAPPAESASASAEGGSSNKENKEVEHIKSENSNSGGDVEMQSAPSLNANSPASLPIASVS